MLWLLPELASLLERGGAKTREAVLDVLIDLVCSFRPEPGFEAAVGPNGVEVDVARSVLQGVLEMRAAIEASPRGLGEAARVEELSQELLHALEDVIRESRP
ncbi:MAG: hypothetical protein HOV80_10795 [Polyangiaceae bacterium]|nr:hypothetical protein [Polyangiaceae bacterium]